MPILQVITVNERYSVVSEGVGGVPCYMDLYTGSFLSCYTGLKGSGSMNDLTV